MSRLSQTPLTSEEIEDELLTSNLINSGGVEDEDALQGMNLNDKKELMRGIQQSKEVCRDQPTSPSLLDRSNFPSLSSASQSNPRTNKLKLHRRPSNNNRTLSLDAEDSTEKIINLIDEDDVEIKREKFCLPGFVNDNAPPLAMPPRPLMRVENPYYCMEGEAPDVAVQRMLAHYMAWKTQYLAEINRKDCSDQCEELEMIEDDSGQEDIFEFKSQSPIQVSKAYTNVRKDISVSPSLSLPARSQRRSSPDSDCVEIEESIMKPEESQLSGWMTATGGRKNKRNCRTNKGKAQENSTPEVDFSFDETWDSRTANWRDGQTAAATGSMLNNRRNSRTNKGKAQENSGPEANLSFDEMWDSRTPNWRDGQTAVATGSMLNNRRSLPRTPVVEEEKVQCPLCQRNFPQSKVENHAALCEPMDIEEGG